MRIGIDARFYNESGVGRYLRNLIVSLQVLDQVNEYFIFLLPSDYKEFKTTANFKKVKADFRWYGVAEQIKLPKLLNNYKLDLVHFPHFNVPIFYKGKFIVTIHDLIHQHTQMKRSTTLNPIFFKIKQIGYTKVFQNAVSNSQKILVPSINVSNLLTKEWRVNSEKIVVTPEAVDDSLISISTQMSKEKSRQILKNLNIQDKYIFYVGNAHPHKNVEGLISAYLNLKKSHPDLKLCLAGYDHYFWRRIIKENKQLGIKYLGKINDDQLVALYKNAEMLVVPSYEEGFGLPLLEAMACGCPIVSSNAGSLPEVGGEAAVYFDPKNIEDMTVKMLEVLDSKSLKKELIEQGNKRYKQFSWKKLAEQTLESYRQ